MVLGGGDRGGFYGEGYGLSGGGFLVLRLGGDQRGHDGLPASEDIGGIAVVGDELGVLGHFELPGDGMAPADINGAAVAEVCAVVFPVMNIGVVLANRSPSDGADAFEGTIDQNGFTVGIANPVVGGGAGELSLASVQCLEAAIDEDVAVIGPGIAYPHIYAAG